MKTQKEAVIWAIDPFEKETKPTKEMVQKLLNWTKVAGLKIQPVHLLAVPLEKPAEFFEGQGLPSYIDAAKRVTEIYLEGLGVMDFLPVKVLLSESANHGESVEELLGFADTVKSPCIVVSSHGRHGLSRLALGSFAESLLTKSSVPVFFLSHSAEIKKGRTEFTRALFATDFSEYSRAAFVQFLGHAARNQLAVTVLNCVSLPSLALSAGFGGAPVMIPEDYFANQEEEARIEGTRWLKTAAAHGVIARLVVKEEGVDPRTAQAILDTAKEEGADLVVMASSSGPVTAFLMGSVAREVFRRGDYPVWVYGPKALQKRGATRFEQSATA